jgi:RNA polymerase sigma-70 factor (ECF subfamily)
MGPVSVLCYHFDAASARLQGGSGDARVAWAVSRKGVRRCNERSRNPVMRDAERKRRFDALAHQYADDLFRFAVWLCRDHALAADLVQETYVRAWKGLDGLRDVDAAKSWLITILRREYARTFERKVPPMTDVDDVVVADEAELTPDERAERDTLRTAMLALDAKYREPLVLQTVMGLSIAEIAVQLELSESAVMTRVFRAREKLRERLQPKDRDGNVHEIG